MRKIEITNRENPEGESSVVIMVSGGDPIVIAPGRSHILDLNGGETVWFGPGIPVERPRNERRSVELSEYGAASVNHAFEDLAARAKALWNDKATDEEKDSLRAAFVADAGIPHLSEDDGFQGPVGITPTPEEVNFLNGRGKDGGRLLADIQRLIHTEDSLRELPFGALRDIASGYGIKGRGKEELIREILAAQEAK